MRLPTQYYPALLGLAMLIQGCMSPQRDMARFLIPGAAEEPIYREKAAEFVRYAQSGSVDKMLEITSALSNATQTDSMRSLYADQVVPEFKDTVVTWDSHSSGDIDERNNAGLMFTGTARGKKTFSFDIVVMKEDGKLVVINIRKHHWYQR